MWYVWTITPQQYKKVIEYLEELSPVMEYLYPMVEKEYTTVKGKYTRLIPLYNNYIFIKYDRNEEVDMQLAACKWIHDYIGVCLDSEISTVKELSGYKYEDIISTHSVRKGCKYKLKNTLFKDMVCTVVDVDKHNLVVSVEIFGADRLIKCKIDDIELER